MFENPNKDIISVILDKFNECDFEDVKKLLTKAAFINKFMYFVIKNKLQYLIDFYKKRDNFELLGHTEAIKSKDIRIIKYLESRYKKYGKFMSYLDDKQIRLIGKYKFYELIDYLKPTNDEHLQVLLGSIAINDYDYIIKNEHKFNDISYNMYRDIIFRKIVRSNNIKFIKHLKITNPFNYHITRAITKNKYNVLEWLIHNSAHEGIIHYIQYCKNLEMFEFISNYLTGVDPLKDRLSEYLDIEKITYIFCHDDNFEVYDYIIKIIPINKNNLLEQIIIGFNEHEASKSFIDIIKKIKQEFNVDPKELFIGKYYNAIHIKNIEDFEYAYNNNIIVVAHIFRNVWNYKFNKEFVEYLLNKFPCLMDNIDLETYDIYYSYNSLKLLKIKIKFAPDEKNKIYEILRRSVYIR